jgi:cytochrome c oxidase subunit 2
LLGLATAHSTNAHDITTITWVMIALAAIFVIAVNFGLLVYVLRFRARRGRTPDRFRGSRGIQLRALGGLIVIALAVFVAGIVFNVKATASPDPGDTTANPPVNIHVVGQQWIWRYEYPEQQDTTAEAPQSPVTLGPTFNDVFSYYELVVPVDTLVRVDLDSTDVVHRWWVPALGPKYEAVPGHTAHFEFKANDIGVYKGASTAFSGASYATMRTEVHVVSQADYQAWLTNQAAEIKAAQTHVQAQLAAGGPPGITSTEAKTEGTGQ